MEPCSGITGIHKGQRSSGVVSRCHEAVRGAPGHRKPREGGCMKTIKMSRRNITGRTARSGSDRFALKSGDGCHYRPTTGDVELGETCYRQHTRHQAL